MREKVERAPAGMGHLDWIWDAWWRLSDERPHIVSGMSAPMGATLIKSIPGKIPWSVVDHWCSAHGYDDDDRDMMDACIQSMDAIFLDWWAAKNKPRR